MPLAVPLMDSSGTSVLKTTVLTPLGSLKLKLMGAAISRLPEPYMKARGAILLWKAICGYDSRPGVAVSSQFPGRSEGRAVSWPMEEAKVRSSKKLHRFGPGGARNDGAG